MAAALLAATPLFAVEPSEADLRWAKAVEQKIAAGPTTVATPSETRATLAEGIAKKLGRQVKVTKTDAGYSVEVRGTETTKK